MPYHENMPIWDVKMSIIAPVTLRHEFRMFRRKELEHTNAFYSDVRGKPNENGIEITISAFAPNDKLAEKAALLFLGRMLDVLSLQLNLPFQIDISGNVLIPRSEENVRRIIERGDFETAFEESRLLSLTEKTFLRSASWFRKGKYTQDPFDRFLALWNSIETTACKYNPNKATCKGKGTICHIWECFKVVWGDCESWEFIGGQKKWIDICNKHRKDIAHGIVPIEVEPVEEVVSKLEELENVSHKFLTDWRKRQLNPVITPEVRNRLK